MLKRAGRKWTPFVLTFWIMAAIAFAIGGWLLYCNVALVLYGVRVEATVVANQRNPASDSRSSDTYLPTLVLARPVDGNQVTVTPKVASSNWGFPVGGKVTVLVLRDASDFVIEGWQEMWLLPGGLLFLGGLTNLFCLVSWRYLRWVPSEKAA